MISRHVTFRSVISLLLFALGFIPTVFAKIQVVTTLPDLAWAAREIGADQVEVTFLLKGTEDPHYADAVPEFIRLAANADVLCSVGLSLEVGWLPKVIARAGNAKIQKGGSGECVTGSKISALGKPSGPVDRSMGDVHPEGNPHFWLSPEAFIAGVEEIRDALVRVEPSQIERFHKAYASLKSKVMAMFRENQKRLRNVLGNANDPVLLEYHSEFAYWLKSYTLVSLGSVEEKPGLPPSAGRLALLSLQIKNSPTIRFILASHSNPRGPLEKLQELTGKSVVRVPTMTTEGGSYIELQNLIVNRVLEGLGGSSTQ